MSEPAKPIQSNFAQLAEHDEQLVRLGLLAERYFPDDPNTSILKLRQLAELLAQKTAASIGLYVSSEEPQFELIRRLQEDKGQEKVSGTNGVVHGVFMVLAAEALLSVQHSRTRGFALRFS